MKRAPQKPTSPPRRPYARPTLTRIELRPDEAVLGMCKTGFINGPLQSTCETPIPCSTPGS